MFEVEDKNEMLFKKYVKETNYKINPSEKQTKNYEDGDTCGCVYPFADEFFELLM